MAERGVSVDHATIQRWVVTYSAQLAEAFHRCKRPVGCRWRMDETYLRVEGAWRYLYCAVEKTGQTTDFLRTEHRDTEVVLSFLTQAIRRYGVPEEITIDGSEANEAASKRYNEAHSIAIIIRQVRYMNNMIEHDHCGVKRVIRPMLGFKSSAAAPDTLVGIELMHMLKKGWWGGEEGGGGLMAAEQFNALAA